MKSILIDPNIGPLIVPNVQMYANTDPKLTLLKSNSEVSRDPDICTLEVSPSGVRVVSFWTARTDRGARSAPALQVSDLSARRKTLFQNNKSDATDVETV